MTKAIRTTSQKILESIIGLRLRWYILIVVILAALVRFTNITAASVWHDEGYTMMLINFDFFDIIQRTMRDSHPPFYYLVASIWQTMFNDSELSIRGLSLVFGVATVVLVYFLVKRLFASELLARLSTLFVAIGPFIVRYSQEARMYSMAAFLVTLATYALVRALQLPKGSKEAWKFWLGYSLVIALSLYTHYFTALIIPVHIVFTLWMRGGFRQVITDKQWWTSNILGALLFVPWLPVLYMQFSRVQAGFWIPKISDETVPSTFMQFLAFTPNLLPVTVEILLFVGFLAFLFLAFRHVAAAEKSSLLLIATWTIAPAAIIVILSLIKQPVFVDRYFVFSAVAFYVLCAYILVKNRLLARKPALQLTAIVTLIIIFVAGISSVYAQANHKMREVGQLVSSQFQFDDVIVSAELYTYFDFSYYNTTGRPTLLMTDDPLSGYGETSLLYDKQNSLRIASLNDPKVVNAKRLWLVGKSGPHYYYESIPAEWRLQYQLETGDSAVRLYVKQ